MSYSVPQGQAVEYPPQVIIEDLDRVHFDPDRSMERWLTALDVCQLGSVVTAVELARDKIENDGGSFGPHAETKKGMYELFAKQQEWAQSELAAYVGHRFGEVRSVFRLLDKPSILYPDSEAFWEMVDGHRIPRKALTWAKELPFQQDKVCIGYRGDAEMAETTDKSSWIMNHKNEDGTFTIPITQPDGTTIHYITPEVCEVEDKTKAFRSLSAACTGFIVWRTDPPLEGQKGELPAHLHDRVHTIQGLGELTVENRRLVRA